MRIGLLIFMWLVAIGHNAFAHEVRPAYLEIHQTGPEFYEVLWKVPALGEDARLAIYIELPEGTHDVAAPRSTFNRSFFRAPLDPARRRAQWTFHCNRGAVGNGH